jgi:hypothetical protein
MEPQKVHKDRFSRRTVPKWRCWTGFSGRIETVISDLMRLASEIAILNGGSIIHFNQGQSETFRALRLPKNHHPA